jgi:parvulin-like peptidyl-prolyl isomerase
MSVDPSAQQGGDQGELALEDLPAAFAPHVAALEVGEVGDPLQAADGWHLFQVVERLPARERPFDEVAADIADRLRQQQGDALLEQRQAEAAGRYNVVVYAQNLPFEYRGEYASGPAGDRSR